MNCHRDISSHGGLSPFTGLLRCLRSRWDRLMHKIEKLEQVVFGKRQPSKLYHDLLIVQTFVGFYSFSGFTVSQLQAASSETEYISALKRADLHVMLPHRECL